MSYSEVLSVCGNWAAILTAIVATIAYGGYLKSRWDREKALERYLRNEKLSGFDEGKRTVTNLMANLSMTEAEVFAAAFRNKKVKPAVIVDEQGRAASLLFEYDWEDLPVPKKF